MCQPRSPLATVESKVPSRGSPELQPGLVRIELFLAVGSVGRGQGSRDLLSSPSSSSQGWDKPGCGEGLLG